MKLTSIITAAAVSLTLAMPVVAHDNCQVEICPEDVRDENDQHAAAIERLDDMLLEAQEDPPDSENNRESADPSNSASDMGDWVDWGAAAGPLQKGEL